MDVSERVHRLCALPAGWSRLARVARIAPKPAKSRGLLLLLLLLLVVLLAKTTSTAKSKGHSGWLADWLAAAPRLVDPVRGVGSVGSKEARQALPQVQTDNS